MNTKTDETDQAWRALGDPTRRAILDLLAEGPATTGDIESRFPISRIAVMKHLRLLADAGLVTARKAGRQRWHYLNGHALDNLAARWLTPLSRRWASRLSRLQKLSEGLSEPMSAKPDIDIAQDVSIAAPPAKVFKALTDDIGAWWGAPYLSRDAVDMSLDGVLGGPFQEIWTNGGGRLLGSVTAIDSPGLIEISGPFHFGLVHGIAEFRLNAVGKGTLLNFTHRAIGVVEEKFAEAAKGGWGDLLGERLRRYAETGVGQGISANIQGEGNKP